MALRTHLHILLSVIEHLGQVIPLVDCFVSEGSIACMIPTVAIIDLLHYLLCFLSPSVEIYVLQFCRRAAPHPLGRR